MGPVTRARAYVVLILVLVAASAVLGACTGTAENAECSVLLDKEQHEVAEQTVDSLNADAGAIESAVEGGISARDERAVNSAVRRLRKTATQLDKVFSQGCA